jgi:hypothetical protein
MEHTWDFLTDGRKLHTEKPILGGVFLKKDKEI